MSLRLNFVVEGQTEERFVNTVLQHHFADQSIFTAAHCVTTRRDRRSKHLRHRGSLTTYAHARDDIRNWVRQEAAGNARFTTMFDLYGLPTASLATLTLRKRPIRTRASRFWKRD